jgi:hypothetical protein
MTILFLKLAIGHFLADYPLQGDFLAAAKNHRKPIPGVPWYQALMAHSAIQAGMVWFVTGNVWFGLIEFFAHGFTDYLKSEGRISFNQDQICHLLCKAAYLVALAA